MSASLPSSPHDDDDDDAVAAAHLPPPPDLESVALGATRLFCAQDDPEGRKRSSDDNREIRHAEGCASPEKKTPRHGVAVSSRAVASRAVACPDGPPPARPTENARAPARPAIVPAITPSPAEATLSPAEALAKELATAAEKSAERRAQRAAAARARREEEYLEAVRLGKRKSREQRKREWGAVKVQLGPSFFDWLRTGAFDREKFKPGHEMIYSESEMENFEAAFQKQLLFNFDAKRRRRKKDERRGLRSDLDLDANEDVATMKTTDRRELSRYVLEDLLKCGGGEQFLVCIRKDRVDDLGFGQIPDKAAKAQRKSKIGGEIIKISSKQFYCLKARIESAPLHDEIKLGMTRSDSVDRAGAREVHKYCTADVWRDGWSLIKQMDVRRVRRAEEARIMRKKRVNKFILGRVRAMKESVAATKLLGENVNAEVASWTTHVRRINSK